MVRVQGEALMFCTCKNELSLLTNLITTLTAKVDKMTATLAQLDTALTALQASVTALGTGLGTLITDYNKLVASAANGVDVTAELNTVNAQAAALQTDLTNVNLADPATVPPAAPVTPAS